MGSVSKKSKDEDWKKIEWKRAKDFEGVEFKNGKYTLFKDISPDDVGQGYLGDCYYMSSLSALASHPNRIKAMFENHEDNGLGLFAVNITKNGQKV